MVTVIAGQLGKELHGGMLLIVAAAKYKSVDCKSLAGMPMELDGTRSMYIKQNSGHTDCTRAWYPMQVQ